MAKQFEIYKCDLCGNVVELLYGSHDALVCCGQPMKLMTENTVDAAREKHVPVIEATPMGCKVKVGAVPHPMETKHWISWIEIMTTDGLHCKKFLNPGDTPEAEFPVKPENVAYAREYCNLHGLWRS